MNSIAGTDRSSRLVLALGLCLVALQPLTPARAELLYFTHGGQVQAPVRSEGGRLRVDTPSGRYDFQASDFRKIVADPSGPAEWQTRRDAAQNTEGAGTRFAAAWWALENGLVPEAVAMLRSAHRADPSHPPTARLVRALDRLDRPCPDPDTGLLLQALGGASFRVETGPHVDLLHQHDPAEARARVDLLERVTTTYYLVMAAHGFDLPTPARRLVSVCLRSGDDYRAFLDSQGVGTFRNTQGYFHPTLKVVVTYGPLATPNTPARAADRKPVDTDRLRLLRDTDATARRDGTAAHEMIHLLVVESGLAPDGVRFPLWLHEGFAAQFEVVRGGRWSGIGRAHDLRLPDWRVASSAASLPSLIRDGGFGAGYRKGLYARSWSLVYFFRKTRPREFATFLDLLRLPCADDSACGPDRAEAAFRTAFGADLDALETEWVTYMTHVRTPLEDHSGDHRTTSASGAAHLD